MGNEQENLIEELEHVIVDKNIGDRAAMLHRVTDLFVVSSGKLNKEQVALFDDVMERLLVEIDTSARATFGDVVARLSFAPPRTVRRLALDNAIEVAGAVLARSEQIDEPALIETARTKSQAHLLAISRRKSLAEPVTDILVERGDRQVALNTAENPGAAFSEFGYSMLVQRSSRDEDLAASVWSRPEVPRRHLLKLFADASNAVKSKLLSQDVRNKKAICEVVAHASHVIQKRVREKSVDYVAAYSHVQSLLASGDLGEEQLAKFAATKKFDETTIALSFICDLPIDMIERVLIGESVEQIIVIAKAAGFSWSTVENILVLQASAEDGARLNTHQAFDIFTRLKAETAKKAIRFYRLREQAAGS